MLTIITVDHSGEDTIAAIRIEWDDIGAHLHRITIHDDMKETDVALIVSEREYHTIWAALRMAQHNIEINGGWLKGMLLTDVASNGGEIEPLTTEEIDDLLMQRSLGTIQPINLNRMAWDKIKNEEVENVVKALIAAGHPGAAVDHLFHVHTLALGDARAAVDWAVSEMEKEKGDGD